MNYMYYFYKNDFNISDLYCSLLFDKDTGVVVYLTKLIGKDEVKE